MSKLSSEEREILEAFEKGSLKRSNDAASTRKRHQAYALMQEHEILKLDETDWEVFLDALESPPRPSERLRKAVAELKKRRQR